MRPDFFRSALEAFDLVAVVVAVTMFNLLLPEPDSRLMVATISPHLSDTGGITAPASLTLRELLDFKVTVETAGLFVAFLVFWHGLFSITGMYAPERMSRIGYASVVDLAKVAAAGATAVWVVAAVAPLPLQTAATLSVSGLLACVISWLARVALQRIRQRRGSRHLLIVGTNARALAMAKRVQFAPEAGYRLVGFVDQPWPGGAQIVQSGYRIVSDFNGFADFLKDQVVDEVLICTPLKSLYDRTSTLLRQCEEQGITVRFAPDPFSPLIGHVHVDHFAGQAVLTVDSGRQTTSRLVAKRCIDICGSVVVLLLAAPLMFAIAAIIKLSSSGPAMFVQQRVGLNKRRFSFYKFRTMVADAEKRLPDLEQRNEVSGPVFKIRHDPRVTRIGRFLRRSSLDELPQLFNVLKGDMSLVGPRPLAVRDYRGISEDWHRRRLSVRPGITCLWQVQGRNSIPFDRWMELDLEYIDNWSLWLDCKILLRTIPAVLSGAGAS
jgi:exopolysaccharide biosynthesis polyprenyl glycosylphosphotransferase